MENAKKKYKCSDISRYVVYCWATDRRQCYVHVLSSKNKKMKLTVCIHLFNYVNFAVFSSGVSVESV